METALSRDIAGAVRAFIAATYLPDEDPARLTDETELVQTGIIDSIRVLHLVGFVEDQYDLELEPQDIQQFTTVGNIARVIRAKIGM
jgi:acyl carrier protein